MLLNQIHKGVVSMEYNNYLYHHGILGQKWGVRRSLQQLGYRISSGFHKNSGDSKSGSGKGKGSSAKGSSSNTAKPQDPNKVKVLVDGKIKVKSLDKMTNQELMDQVNRISNINKIREMNGAPKAEKSPEEMTGQELQDEVNRLTNLQKYKELTAPPPTFKEKVLKDTKEVVYNSIKSAGQTQLTALLNKVGGKAISELFPDGNQIAKDAKEAKSKADQATKKKEEKASKKEEKQQAKQEKTSNSGSKESFFKQWSSSKEKYQDFTKDAKDAKDFFNSFSGSKSKNSGTVIDADYKIFDTDPSTIGKLPVSQLLLEDKSMR
jgi:ribosomal protein L12E/L44/L45/RPP1/RPP2